MFMIELKESIWWYWAVTCLFLWITLTIYPFAFIALFIITLTQIIHLRWQKNHLFDFAIQVRLAFLAYLVMCIPEGMDKLLWLPAIGSLARILFGYCLLARLLMLMPFNRSEPLSREYITKVFFNPPVKGSIQSIIR